MEYFVYKEPQVKTGEQRTVEDARRNLPGSDQNSGSRPASTGRSLRNNATQAGAVAVKNTQETQTPREEHESLDGAPRYRTTEPIAHSIETQTIEQVTLGRRASQADDLQSMNQRYKALVTENERKNNAIWLKRNSVVRVPKHMRTSHEEALKEFYDQEEQKRDNRLKTIEERKNNESSTLSKKEEIQRLREGVDKLVPKNEGGRAQQLNILEPSRAGKKTEVKDNLVSFESEREKVLQEDSVVIHEGKDGEVKATIESVNIIDERYFERSNQPGPTSIQQQGEDETYIDTRFSIHKKSIQTRESCPVSINDRQEPTAASHNQTPIETAQPSTRFRDASKKHTKFPGDGETAREQTRPSFPVQIQMSRHIQKQSDTTQVHSKEGLTIDMRSKPLRLHETAVIPNSNESVRYTADRLHIHYDEQVSEGGITERTVQAAPIGGSEAGAKQVGPSGKFPQEENSANSIFTASDKAREIANVEIKVEEDTPHGSALLEYYPIEQPMTQKQIDLRKKKEARKSAAHNHPKPPTILHKSLMHQGGHNPTQSGPLPAPISKTYKSSLQAYKNHRRNEALNTSGRQKYDSVDLDERLKQEEQARQRRSQGNFRTILQTNHSGMTDFTQRKSSNLLMGHQNPTGTDQTIQVVQARSTKTFGGSGQQTAQGGPSINQEQKGDLRIRYGTEEFSQTDMTIGHIGSSSSRGPTNQSHDLEGRKSRYSQQRVVTKPSVEISLQENPGELPHTIQPSSKGITEGAYEEKIGTSREVTERLNPLKVPEHISNPVDDYQQQIVNRQSEQLVKHSARKQEIKQDIPDRQKAATKEILSNYQIQAKNSRHANKQVNKTHTISNQSAENSANIFSQKAMYSTDGKVNEQDLVSSKVATQNDYLADESAVNEWKHATTQGVIAESKLGSRQSEKASSLRQSTRDRARQQQNSEQESIPREVAESPLLLDSNVASGEGTREPTRQEVRPEQVVRHDTVSSRDEKQEPSQPMSTAQNSQNRLAPSSIVEEERGRDEEESSQKGQVCSQEGGIIDDEEPSKEESGKVTERMQKALEEDDLEGNVIHQLYAANGEPLPSIKGHPQPKDLAGWNEISIEQIKELGSAEESSRKQSSKFLHTDDQRLKSELYRTEKSQGRDNLVQDSIHSAVNQASVKNHSVDMTSGNIIIEEQNIKPDGTPIDNFAVPGFDHSKVLQEGAGPQPKKEQEPVLRGKSIDERGDKGSSSLTVSQPISIEANLIAQKKLVQQKIRHQETAGDTLNASTTQTKRDVLSQRGEVRQGVKIVEGGPLTSAFGSLDKSVNHEKFPEYHDMPRQGPPLHEIHSSFDHIKRQHPRPAFLRNQDLAEESFVRNGSSEADPTTSDKKAPFNPAQQYYTISQSNQPQQAQIMDYYSGFPLQKQSQRLFGERPGDERRALQVPAVLYNSQKMPHQAMKKQFLRHHLQNRGAPPQVWTSGHNPFAGNEHGMTSSNDSTHIKIHGESAGRRPLPPPGMNSQIDPEFAQKFTEMRKVQAIQGPQMKVKEDFNLKTFMEQNMLDDGFFFNTGSQGISTSRDRPSGLQEFQRNKLKGKQGGQARDISEELRGRYNQFGGQGVILARSMENEKLAPRFETSPWGREPMNDSKLRRIAIASNSREREVELMKAVENGMIDIDQTFLLVQFIKRQHGLPILTDAHILKILQEREKSFGSSRKPSESMSLAMREFKLSQIKSFMHANPQVLSQLLGMQNNFWEIDRKPYENQFPTSKPRYTDKILKQIYHGLPGLMGQVPPTNSHQVQFLQSIITKKNTKPRRNINLPNFQGNAPIVPRDSSIYSKPLKKKNKTSHGGGSLDKEHKNRMQQHLDKNSFSPAAVRNVAKARRANLQYQDGKHPSPKRGRTLAGRSSSKSLKTLRKQIRAQQESYNKYLQKQKLLQSSQEEEIQQEDSFNSPYQNPAEQEPTRPQFHPRTSGGDRLPKLEEAKLLNPHEFRGGSRFDHAKASKLQSQPVINNEIEVDDQNETRKRKKSQNVVQITRDKGDFHELQYRQMQMASSGGPTHFAAREDHLPLSEMGQQKDAEGQLKISSEIQIQKENLEMKKPKTNERKKRNPRQMGHFGPQAIIDSQSVQTKQQYGGTRNRYGRMVDENMIKSNNKTQYHARDLPNIPDVTSHTKSHRGNILIDQRTELTSGGSLVISRFEDLATQKKNLENEELELFEQRRKVVAEKDKVTKQLKRLDKKQELAAQEEHVKKKRMILEIEKKKLREDIAELDQLKDMLEKKKKDTNTGFSELAESNKEMRSLKSGDLHRETSLMMSKQSSRSKQLGTSFVDFKQQVQGQIGGERPKNARAMLMANQVHSHQTQNNTKDESLNNSVLGHQLPQKNPTGPIQSVQASQAPSIQQAHFQDGHASIFDSNNRSRSRTLEQKQSQEKVKDYVDIDMTTEPQQPESVPDSKRQSEDYGNGKMTSTFSKSRRSMLQTGAPVILEEHSKEQALDSIENSVNPMEEPSVSHPELQNSAASKRRQQSPHSVSNLTYLSGVGLFDWANSQVMEDVMHGREKFTAISEEDQVYSEDEVFAMIEKIKKSQRQLRDPARLKEVYSSALNTLQELMSQMNQQILFQMIAKKYTEVSIDNTVKLLVRCKQLLQSRALAYGVLQQILDFETNVTEIRKQVDFLLDDSPRENLVEILKNQSASQLPKIANQILADIVELRDTFKLFSKMGATTSKGNSVLNVMAYKRRDAIRYVLKEYEQVRKLVSVVDIKMPLLRKPTS